MLILWTLHTLVMKLLKNCVYIAYNKLVPPRIPSDLVVVGCLVELVIDGFVKNVQDKS